VRAQDSIEGLKRLIIERTEGNPFFMEETVQVLLDEGALVRNDTVHLTKPLAELKIPPTVQAILASRIDRLPPDEKELLQTLAVIGREFALSLVRRVYDGRKDNELERMLADLQTAEFIYEQPAAGDIEYIFKHALTQEVSYNALLFERRKQIHERTAEAIELLFAASMADHYERLAHHYGRSGNVRKAVSYLQLAAQQAMNRSAYAEASGQLDSALELLRTQPDDLDRDRTEIAIRFDRAICVNLSVKGAFAATAALDNLERARELSEKIGDDIGLLRLLAALAFIYSNRFEKEKARTVCEKLLRIATRTHDPERIGHAWCWLGFSSLWEGNFRAALEQFDRACQLPVGGSPKREVTFGNWRTLSRSLASQTLWLLGYPDRAAVMSRESVAIARGIVDSASDLVATLFWAAFFNLLKRDGSSAYRQADEAGNLARDNGLTALLATTAFGRAWALVQTGKIKEGLSEMVRWRTELLQTAAGTVAAAVFYLEVAEVYLAASRRREGLEAVADGLALMEGTGTGFGEAEMRRLKGELLLNSDSSAAAEAAQSFREAIEVARRQSAKSWELRATMSLARLLDKQGNRDEARAMLAEIYNWFTEGFDTTDLIDAKALLKELN
jgi:adenylate cyclase